MYTKNYNTTKYKSQVTKILHKAKIKKEYNQDVISWLISQNETEKALKISHCASYIGITDIQGIAKVVKADFCRERICHVCAWRRQSKFVAQMLPVIEHLQLRGYDFLFATLTLKNVPYEALEKTIDLLMKGYHKLHRKTKIKRSWEGITRSLELTYNEETDTFHPHIHLLIAVKQEYFKNPDLYISQEELCQTWKDILNLDYMPLCDIRKVNDTGEAAVETLKYALKPSKNEKALSAFYNILKGRRLVSFTGVFAQMRKALKLSTIDDLEDDIPQEIKQTRTTFTLYKFDVTGGVYSYYKDLEMIL